MDTLLQDIRREVEDLHAFFVKWFNGTVDKDRLEPEFLSHLGKDVLLISPDGHVLSFEKLRDVFGKNHGANPEFRIAIRDVKILRQFGSTVLVNYTEWQAGAKASALAQNARITSALIEVGSPPTWLYIHETWLPEEIRAVDPFTF